MDKRIFLKSVLMSVVSFVLGGAIVRRFLLDKEPEKKPQPQTIEKLHQGNKKNVLVLMSAGTRQGNTDRLTNAYIRGVIERGYSVTKIYLGNTRLEGCRGCGACQRNSNRCVIKDEMQNLYPLFAECDAMVMASPLYFWTVTARLKSFIERLYAISTEDRYPSKDVVLLMTAGDDTDTTFEQPLSYYRIISQIFGGNNKGTYFAGGCTGCEELERHIDEKHLENAYKMGLEL